jgi:hypothetical protein
MAKPFALHDDSIAPPLSLSAIVKKYGASAADIRAVRAYFEKTGKPITLAVRNRKGGTVVQALTIRPKRATRVAHKSRSRRKP